MKAVSIDTGGSGHEAALDGRDDFATPWVAAVDLAQNDDREALTEGAAFGALAAGSKSGLPRTCTEQQLADWIDAVVDHDERALGALYNATFSRVFGLVRRIARNTAMTEEVVEDTYFQVWRQAIRFDPERGNALSWLLAIARSRALDALRREARFRHERLDDNAELNVTSDARPNDELLDLARHHADLHKALLLIGAQPRQLVSLAFFRGLSHEEIAQHTQLPLGTVKSQLRRALLALRQILGEGDFRALAS
jgi:RNA polymerase sigma-70 factor (ECF subfamily)